MISGWEGRRSAINDASCAAYVVENQGPLVHPKKYSREGEKWHCPTNCIGAKSTLLRSVLINWSWAIFFLKFKGTPSKEEHKTIFQNDFDWQRLPKNVFFGLTRWHYHANHMDCVVLYSICHTRLHPPRSKLNAVDFRKSSRFKWTNWSRFDSISVTLWSFHVAKCTVGSIS